MASYAASTPGPSPAWATPGTASVRPNGARRLWREALDIYTDLGVPDAFDGEAANHLARLDRHA